MKHSLILLCLFLCGISVSSCCIPGIPASKPQKIGQVTAKGTAPRPTEKPKPKIFNVGDKVQLGTWDLVVHQVGDYVSDNQFSKPKDGNKFYYVEASVQNNGDETASYNALEFTIQDSNGYTYQGMAANKEPGFGCGDLQTTRKVRGNIVFEIPISATGLELIYQPGWWDKGQIIVKLQ